MSFYDKDVFYYQGTKFIDAVEQLLVEQMRQYLGCTEVETRVISGQMCNMAAFSALMDWKNRLDRKAHATAPGLCAEQPHHQGRPPVGPTHGRAAGLHRRGPGDRAHRRGELPRVPATISISIDVEETKKVIERYRPELIIFGKSMVLHREPVADIRQLRRRSRTSPPPSCTTWPTCWV